MDELKERMPEWDFIKGLLIIFVVWGHVCSYISDFNYESNELTSVIRLYQMPMFILISGYFQKSCNTIHDVKIRAIKIFRTLFIPYICWSVVGCSFYLGMSLILSNSLIPLGGYKCIQLLYRQSILLWFLGCLILCELLYAVLSFISEKYNTKIFILVLSIVFSITISYNIWYFNFLWPFFLCGVLFNRSGNYITRLIDMFYKYNGLIGGMSVIVLLLLSQLYKTEYTFYNASNCILAYGVTNAPNYLLFIVFRYVSYGVVTVTYMCFFLMIYDSIKRRRLSAYIVDVGKNTLGIFFIHIIFLYHVFRPIVEEYTNGAGILPKMPFIRYYVVAVIISAFVIILSNIVTKLIKKINLLKFLLLGK